jgi:hypothetical protein
MTPPLQGGELFKTLIEFLKCNTHFIAVLFPFFSRRGGPNAFGAG